MSARRRAITILSAIFVLVVMASIGRRLRFDQDIAVMLPDTSTELRGAAAVLRSVLERTIVDVGVPEGRTLRAGELGRAADRLADELTRSGQVARARSRMEAGQALPVIALLRERAPLYVSAEALRQIEERTQPEAVSRTLSTLARRLQEPDGAYLATSAASDPLGLSNLALAPLASLTAGFGSAHLVDGRITSEDGRHVLVILEPGFPPTEMPRSEALFACLDRVAADLALDPGVEVRTMGAHRATLDNAHQIKRDVALTTTIGVVLVALLAILTFSRLDLALLSLTPGLFGGVFALGAFALFRDSVPAMVGGFGSVLLGLTLDYAIQVLYRFDTSDDGRFEIPVGPLSAAGGIMTIAFLSLRWSSLPGVRDIGTFGALGVGAATVFAIVVLPALGARATRRRAPILDLSVLVRWFHARSSTLLLLVGLFVLTPLAAVGARRLRFDGDVTHLSSLSPHTRADEEAIARDFGEAFRLTSVVVVGATLEEALEANDRISELLDQAVAAREIRAHASIAGLLPSVATQEARLRAWRAFWTAERVEALRGALAQAAGPTPFRPDAFEPFLAWLLAHPPPVREEDLGEGDLGRLVHDRISRADGRFSVSTPVSTETFEQVEALRVALSSAAPGAFLVNKEAMVRHFATMVRDDMALLGAVGFALVGVLLFLWYGSIELTLIVMLPLALGCLWMLGILGWLGIPITLPSSVVGGLLFGTTVEYSIFIMSSRLDRFRTGADRTVPSDVAVILCDLTTVLGFGALALAGHPVLFSIGITALIGDVTAEVTGFLFVPPLARAVLRLHGTNGTPRLRTMYAGLWALYVLVGGALRYACFTRWRLRPEERERAAIDAIRDITVRIRAHTPIGRRIYLGADDAGRFAKPAIFVANHVSMYDIVAILALPIRVQILVKEWVWRAPVMGAMVREAGYILAENVPPGDVFERAAEALSKGISVLVFPEGSRSHDGTTIGRFHNGAFAIARRSGVQVIPIALVGTRDVVRRGTWWVGDHDIRLAVLDSMDPADFPGEEGDRHMARAARDRIREASRRLWPETQTGPGWHRPLSGAYRYLGTLVSRRAATELRRDPLLRALPEICPGTDEVLVAGCGYGLVTIRLATAFPGRRIRSIDLDGQKIEVARTALGESASASFHEGDLRDVDLGAPGTVTLLDVLGRSAPEVQRAILLRIAAVLPAGGRLLFRDGVAAGAGALHHRTPEGWRALLAECGFDVESSRPELGSRSSFVLLARKAPADAALSGHDDRQRGERGTTH